MTRTIQLTQFCYTSLPRSVTGTGGWQTFARSPGFDRARLIEEHCQYERPRMPANRTDEQMPIDYGYRTLDEDHACIYRICFAGTDEFGRRGNYFVHTLVFKRAHLDAIDADVPALFEWANRRRVFFDNHAQVLERYPDKKFELEPLEAPVADLLDWRRNQDERPLLDWLEPYPADQREKVAQDALRAILTPPEQRRPVIWIGPQNGQDNSAQEMAVVRFLFAALPFAWRRQATFSTYRKAYQNASARWVGTVVENPTTIGEEQRKFQFYVINGPHPARSSELPPPDCHPWIKELVRELDRPFGKSAVGQISRFANHFQAASDADLFKPTGFLARVGRCYSFSPEKDADIQLVLKLLPTARPDRPAVLDWLHRGFKDADLRKQPWLESSLAELVEAYHDLAAHRNASSLGSEKRQEGIKRFYLQLISLACTTHQPKAAAPLVSELRSNPALDFVRSTFREAWLAKLCDEVSKSPTAKMLGLINDLLEPYFGETSARDPERREFEGRLRQSLCSNPDGLDPELSKKARELLWPLFRRHQPASADELQHALNLWVKVKDFDGPDLLKHYLKAVCINLGAPDALLPELRESHAWLFLQYRPEWGEIATDLPEPWRDLLRTVTASFLWESFWREEPPVQRDRCYKQFQNFLARARETTDPTRFSTPYLTAHAAVLDQRLARLRAARPTSGSRPYAQYLCYARLLNFLAQHCPATREKVQRQVLQLLALLYRDGRDVGEEPLAEAIQALARCAPLAEERRDLYLELTRQLQEVTSGAGPAALDRTLLQTWYRAFSKIGGEEDAAEGVFVLGCLLTMVRPARSEGQSALRDLVLQECLGRPEMIRAPRHVPFGALFVAELSQDDPERLRTLGKRLHSAWSSSKDPRGWCDSTTLGWWLLTWKCLETRDGRWVSLLETFDWRELARLHRVAVSEDAQNQLGERLERRFEDFTRKLQSEGERLPPDAWPELAQVLYVLPARNPALLSPLLKLVQHGLRETPLRTLGPQLDERTVARLVPWCCELQVPEGFWDVVRGRISQPASLDFIYELACTCVPDAALGGDYGVRLLRVRTQMASWLWDGKEPQSLAEFLGRAGDWPDPQGPIPSYAPPEATAFVLAHYLFLHQDRWEKVVNWLFESKAWERVFELRTFGDRILWKRFDAALRSCLDGQPIDARKVLKKLQ